MTFRVRELQNATRDVTAILSWFVDQQQAPDGAARWLRAYESAVASLAHMPERHSLAPENDRFTEDVRQFLFRTRRGHTYRGLFIIDQDEVLILRIRGPHQAPVEPGEL